MTCSIVLRNAKRSQRRHLLCADLVSPRARVRNGQPDGGLTAEGSSPLTTIVLFERSIAGSGTRTAWSKAAVYGGAARSYRSSAGLTLDQLPEVQHPGSVSQISHQRKVVGDDDVGQIPLALKTLHQVQVLRLNRDIHRQQLSGPTRGRRSAVDARGGGPTSDAVDVTKLARDFAPMLGELAPERGAIERAPSRRRG